MRTIESIIAKSTPYCPGIFNRFLEVTAERTNVDFVRAALARHNLLSLSGTLFLCRLTVFAVDLHAPTAENKNAIQLRETHTHTQKQKM